MRRVVFLMLLVCVTVLSGCTVDINQHSVVSIQLNGSFTGNGVVVAKHGGWYYVATAKHVVQPPNIPERLLELVSPTYRLPVYSVDGHTADVVERSALADAAIIRFRSKIDYRIWKLEVYVPELGSPLVIPSWMRFYREKSFLRREVRLISLDIENRYLGYSGGIFPGMSGSPVFNDRNRVVGVVSAMPILKGYPFESVGLVTPASEFIYLLRKARD